MKRKSFRYEYVLSVYLILMSTIVMAQTISMGNPFSPQKFHHFIVDNSADIAHSFIGVADLNNDNQTDILAFEGGVNGYLSWYNYPEFKQHFISYGDFHEERPISADIDNDGDMDIFVYKDGACWYENPLPDGDVYSTWTVHFCGEADLRVKDYGSGDFDRDGKLDLVFIGYNNTFIFFQDG
ncbi:MAG: VCBS repeat-containing protein, partial [Bacteroidales bacterium]|nr:VCBS repeat-containing protein [Bacteroidales bacterium]